MADQSDVENALVDLIAAALYPEGTALPSVVGADCRVYRGWPGPAALDADLAAGRVNVTVFPAGADGRTTTRWAPAWQVGVAPRPTLQVSVSGLSATFSGSADPGQLAGLMVDGRSYVWRTQSGDTPALVAANLAAAARADAIALLSGATVTVPRAGRFGARVVTDATARVEVRRQVRGFRITCWCPSPSTRDTTAAAIDAALAPLMFLSLADGTQGRLTYDGTTVFDQSQDAALYRRDLLYSVEYATVVTQTQPAMLFGAGALNATPYLG